MDLQQVLFEELKFEESSNLDKSPSWSGIRDIPNIDAVYKIGNQRIVYFSRMFEIDYEQLLETYKAIWNESEAPLLYVSLPHEIRIYNCYNQPPQEANELDNEERLLKRLTEIINIEDAIAKIHQQINHFDRIHLDSETFWNTSDGQKIDREQRADQLLLRSILAVREQLVSEFKLSNEIAYDLLGRSIFIQYLEDRGFLTEELIREITSGKYSNHNDVLTDFDATYSFYERLSERFGGDIFPVRPQEKDYVTQNILGAIRNFIGGSIYVGKGTTQLLLFSFDFRYMPIGFISEIYDAFVENRRSTGSYYTSQALVDFILEETMPFDKITPKMRILDPACGSGVFLVRAYQRLVDAWIQENKQRPNYQTLSNILKHSIYGCDINAAAARIAVFNLYLAMLDYLPIDDFNKPDFSLPKLLKKTILPLDFFSDEFANHIGKLRFDRIIGNPPWGKTTLSKSAEKIAKQKDYHIGGKQIVQVFLLYAPEFCNDTGEVAFVAPVKATILVKDETHQRFHQQFLDKYHPRVIVNFAALRKKLFGRAISPSLVIFYSPRLSEDDKNFAYCVPKMSLLYKQTGTILLDATEVKFLSVAQIKNNPFIWKTALWGNHRDIGLILRLHEYRSLDEIVQELGWERGQGFIVARKNRTPKPWLTGMLYLPTDNFTKYVVLESELKIILETKFRDATPRMRDVLFKSPSALVLKGIDNQSRKLSAAYNELDIAFQDQVVAFVAQDKDKDLLKWLTIFINSNLAQYYYFMTSTSWGIERDRVIQKELRELPFLIPARGELGIIVELFEQISEIVKDASEKTLPQNQQYIELEYLLNQRIYDIFDLTETERIQVEDTIQYIIDFFYWSDSTGKKPRSAISLEQPNTQILSDYTQLFSDTLNSLLKYQQVGLNSTIYTNGAPLCVVEFQKVSLEQSGQTSIRKSSTELQEILKRLDERLLQQHSASIFMRRHVRIYDGDRFYIIRPNEIRFWTRAQSLADADETLNEWLNTSKTQQKEEAL